MKRRYAESLRSTEQGSGRFCREKPGGPSHPDFSLTARTRRAPAAPQPDQVRTLAERAQAIAPLPASAKGRRSHSILRSLQKYSTAVE